MYSGQREVPRAADNDPNTADYTQSLKTEVKLKTHDVEVQGETKSLQWECPKKHKAAGCDLSACFKKQKTTETYF